MPDDATTRHPTKSSRVRPWTLKDAAAHYAMDRWGEDYFSINTEGDLCVHPDRSTMRRIPLTSVLKEALVQGLHPPLLLRFEDSIRDRLHLLADSFQTAIKQHQYQGDYRLAYPIKVNQQSEVIQQIIKHGQAHHFGLEAGSKAELMAILGLSANTPTPIFCNGFKDQAYIHTAVMANQMGRPVTIIIEKAHEAALIAQACQTFNSAPQIGLRIKLHTQVDSRWSESGGQRSKFGLRYDEVPQVLDTLSAHGLSSQIKLLHAHGGSQIYDLDDLKTMCLEMTRIYCDLHRDLPALEQLDLGGGLGVNYDGAFDASPDSVSYSLMDYASTMIETIQTCCNQHDCPHPTLITESGRFLVAHHSLLLVNLLPSQSHDPSPSAQDSNVLDDEFLELQQVLTQAQEPDDLENAYLTIQTLSENTHQDFLKGQLSFQQSSKRTQGLRELLDQLENHPLIYPSLLKKVQAILAPLAFANFSIFQSLPDSWALGQRFPVMPIQWLDHPPDQQIILGDLTCDSDGQINQFPGAEGIQTTLSIHRKALQSSHQHDQLPYCLGIFLTGAYQEILGDMHNLFGDTHRILISIDEHQQWQISQTLVGDQVSDLLRYVEIDLKDMMNRLRTELDQARLNGQLSPQQADQLLADYHDHLKAYTYLT